MLWYFNDFYPDELFYSGCARYHYYSGHMSLKDTSIDLFGVPNAVPNKMLPSYLNYFSNQLRHTNYTPEKIIAHHSQLPYFAPFMRSEKLEALERDIRESSVRGLFHKIGLRSGQIGNKHCFYYCSKCIRSDVEAYGEAYIHRLHQIDGVTICNKHHMNLLPYTYNLQYGRRVKFERIDATKINIGEISDSEEVEKLEIKIAEASEYLLSHDLREFNHEKIVEMYSGALISRGMFTSGGVMRIGKLKTSFVDHYGSDILIKYGSAVSIESRGTWLDTLFRKNKSMIHPLRHILFLLYLGCDCRTFFESEIPVYNPFCEPFSIDTDFLPIRNQCEYHQYDNMVADFYLPEKPNNGKVAKHIDWPERDKALVEELRSAYILLIRAPRMIRITRTSLGIQCSCLEILLKKIDQVPLCKRYLERVCETVEDYHIRKVKHLCRKHIRDGEKIKEWAVFIEAGFKEGTENVRVVIQRYMYLQNENGL